MLIILYSIFCEILYNSFNVNLMISSNVRERMDRNRDLKTLKK